MAGSIIHVNAFNSLASVTAGQTQAGLTLNPNTTYQLDGYLHLSGVAPVPGVDSDNLIFEINGTFSAPLPHPAVVGSLWTWRVFVVTDGTGNVWLQTIRAGTVGTVYHTGIFANPLPNGWIL